MEYGRLDHNKVGQEAEESQSGAISAQEEGQHGFYILHYLIHKIRSRIKPTSNRDCIIYIIYIKNTRKCSPTQSLIRPVDNGLGFVKNQLLLSDFDRFIVDISLSKIWLKYFCYFYLKNVKFLQKRV